MNNHSIEKLETIEHQSLVDHVDSGLPRWLIEVAFVSYLLQAVVCWTEVSLWMVFYILISSLLPVVVVLLFKPEQTVPYLLLEIITAAVVVVYAWVQRRVLI